MADLKDFAEFMKRAAEEMKDVPESASVLIHSDGNAIQIHLTNKSNYYGEWIKGEGADICLYRDRETNRVVGCMLPLYVDTVHVGVVGDKIKLKVHE